MGVGGVEDIIESRTPDNVRHLLHVCISEVMISFFLKQLGLLDRSAE